MSAWERVSASVSRLPNPDFGSLRLRHATSGPVSQIAITFVETGGARLLQTFDSRTRAFSAPAAPRLCYTDTQPDRP